MRSVIFAAFILAISSNSYAKGLLGSEFWEKLDEVNKFTYMSGYLLAKFDQCDTSYTDINNDDERNKVISNCYKNMQKNEAQALVKIINMIYSKPENMYIEVRSAILLSLLINSNITQDIDSRYETFRNEGYKKYINSN